MERYRPIQTGYVFARCGAWYVQYREDARDAAGVITRKKMTRYLCPMSDPLTGKQTGKREAARLAYEEVLRKVNDQAPRPAMLATLEEFWRARFEPEHISTLKKAGRNHYRYAKGKIMPDLGEITLREITHGHIQALIGNALKQGLSPQTAQHIKNAVSALFRYAQVCGAHQGPNPAQGVRLPPMRRRQRVPLTFAEAHALIQALTSPAKEMAFLSMLTSMNVAEMAALRLQYVNLTERPRLAPAGTIPPCCVLVRENYYQGEFDTTKTANRTRLVPLAPRLVEMLQAHVAASARPNTPDALLFHSRTGGPVDQKNLLNRKLKPAALRVLGRKDVAWHTFRHCTATWADWVNMPVAERVAIMGHSNAAMTMHYTHADMDRRRPYLAALETLLLEAGPTGKEDEGGTTIEIQPVHQESAAEHHARGAA